MPYMLPSLPKTSAVGFAPLVPLNDTNLVNKPFVVTRKTVPKSLLAYQLLPPPPSRAVEITVGAHEQRIGRETISAVELGQCRQLSFGGQFEYCPKIRGGSINVPAAAALCRAVDIAVIGEYESIRNQPVSAIER